MELPQEEEENGHLHPHSKEEEANYEATVDPGDVQTDKQTGSQSPGLCSCCLIRLHEFIATHTKQVLDEQSYI